MFLHLTVSEIDDFICKTQEYCKQSKQKWFIVKKSNELQHWKIQSGFKSLFWSQGIVSLRWVIPKKWLNTYNCWNIGQIRHRCPTSWFTFFVRKGRPCHDSLKGEDVMDFMTTVHKFLYWKVRRGVTKLQQFCNVIYGRPHKFKSNIFPEAITSCSLPIG